VDGSDELLPERMFGRSFFFRRKGLKCEACGQVRPGVFFSQSSKGLEFGFWDSR